MSKMAMSALAPAQSALVRAMQRIRPADGGGVEDMLRRDLGRPAARAIIIATAMFSTMSGGAVSVPMPMLIPSSRHRRNERSISPSRA